MYPAILFHIFPLIIIPPLPSQPNLGMRRLSRLNDYQITIQPGTGEARLEVEILRKRWARKTRNSNPLSITFPVFTSPTVLVKQENDVCFTLDGRIGICRQRHQCQHFDRSSPAEFAEIISPCRQDRSLICCPGSFQISPLFVRHQRPSVKPAPSRVQVKDEIPLEIVGHKDESLKIKNPSKANKSSLSSKSGANSSSNAIRLLNSTDFHDDTKASVNPPNVHISTDFDFNSPDAQKVCGLFDPKQQSSWPWINLLKGRDSDSTYLALRQTKVSIGRKYSNGTVDWACLGSLITTKYILTTAHCLQRIVIAHWATTSRSQDTAMARFKTSIRELLVGRNPTIVAVGQAFVGVMTAHEDGSVISSIITIAESFQMNKYANTTMYKNIGLVRLTASANVTSRISPICFPFLAGVLDIIEFSGSFVQTLSLRFSAKVVGEKADKTGQFQISEYRVVNNTFCSSAAPRNDTVLRRKFPKGIKQDIMCISPLNTRTYTTLEGAPLVLLDKASDAYVIVGISTGASFNGLGRNGLDLCTRVNAFSSWVRDNVGELPTPAPCYL